MVKEALHERANLLEIAPHLSAPLPIMLPVYKWVPRISVLHYLSVGFSEISALFSLALKSFWSNINPRWSLPMSAQTRGFRNEVGSTVTTLLSSTEALKRFLVLDPICCLCPFRRHRMNPRLRGLVKEPSLSGGDSWGVDYCFCLLLTCFHCLLEDGGSCLTTGQESRCTT